MSLRYVVEFLSKKIAKRFILAPETTVGEFLQYLKSTGLIQDPERENLFCCQRTSGDELHNNFEGNFLLPESVMANYHGMRLQIRERDPPEGVRVHMHESLPILLDTEDLRLNPATKTIDLIEKYRNSLNDTLFGAGLVFSFCFMKEFKEWELPLCFFPEMDQARSISYEMLKKTPFYGGFWTTVKDQNLENYTTFLRPLGYTEIHFLPEPLLLEILVPRSFLFSLNKHWDVKAAETVDTLQSAEEVRIFMNVDPLLETGRIIRSIQREITGGQSDDSALEKYTLFKVVYQDRAPQHDDEMSAVTETQFTANVRRKRDIQELVKLDPERPLFLNGVSSLDTLKISHSSSINEDVKQDKGAERFFSTDVPFYDEILKVSKKDNIVWAKKPKRRASDSAGTTTGAVPDEQKFYERIAFSSYNRAISIITAPGLTDTYLQLMFAEMVWAGILSDTLFLKKMVERYNIPADIESDDVTKLKLKVNVLEQINLLVKNFKDGLTVSSQNIISNFLDTEFGNLQKEEKGTEPLDDKDLASELEMLKNRQVHIMEKIKKHLFAKPEDGVGAAVRRGGDVYSSKRQALGQFYGERRRRLYYNTIFKDQITADTINEYVQKEKKMINLEKQQMLSAGKRKSKSGGVGAGELRAASLTRAQELSIIANKEIITGKRLQKKLAASLRKKKSSGEPTSIPVVYFDVRHLARHLTDETFTFFEKINLRDMVIETLRLQGKGGELNKDNSVYQIRERYNRLTAVYQTEALRHTSRSKRKDMRNRVRTVEYLIKLAKILYDFNNHFDSMAIVMALDSTVVSRLRKTCWDRTSEWTRETFSSLKSKLLGDGRLNDGSMNWVLKEVKKMDLPGIPYIGAFSGGVFALLSRPTFTKDRNLLDWEKLRSLFDLSLSITRFQLTKYQFDSVLEISRWYRSYKEWTEDEMWEVSVQIEE